MTVNRAPISRVVVAEEQPLPSEMCSIRSLPETVIPQPKALADYICTGSGSNKIDYLTIQEAINAHDEILLLPRKLLLRYNYLRRHPTGCGR
jgi:hypothetical protein